MAGNGTPISTMATRITIDDMQAVESLRGIKNQVSSLMNSWKAQNAMLNSVGDHLGAAKAKYEGLGDAIQKQEEYISKLKSEIETIDTSTNKGSEAYARLTKQLSIAQKQLANLNAQQERAKKSMDYYASGADKVKASLKEMTTSSNLMIEKLKAEGKTYQANYEQSRLYANQLSKMSSLHEKLKSSLNSIAAEQGKESDAYKRTASSLQKLDTEMAKTRSAQSKLNESFSSTNIAAAKIHDNYNKISKSVSQVGSGVKSMAGKIVSAGATAGVAVAGLSAGFVKASQKASDLSSTYTRVTNLLETGGEKVSQATKNVAEMQKQGRELSLKYGKSQQDIAEAYEELTKRGYSSEQSLGAMKSMLQASVASGDDFKDVVSVATGALEGFGMKADDTKIMMQNTYKAVDQLAFAADKTSTGFHDLGTGFSYVASTAHTAGISFSETASALGILSNNHIEASKAGTGLRKVINSLTGTMKGEVLAGQGMQKVAAERIKQQGQLREANLKLKQEEANLNKIQDKSSAKYQSQSQKIEMQKAKVEDLTDSYNALANIKPGKQSPLEAIGINPKDLVDANGKMKSLSTVLGMIEDHTKNMGAAKKAAVFNALFGSTGQNAAMILADNAKQLKNLDDETEKSVKNDYLGKLAQKNMGTAKMAMQQFKMAGQDVEMTLSKAVLPTVTTLAHQMAIVMDTKGFQSFVGVIGKGLGSIGNSLQGIFKYIGKNSSEFTSMGKSVATIIGEFGSGVWATFSGVIKGISKSILNMFGDKSTGNAAKDLSKALADIASHKQAIKVIGETFATYFVTKKFLGIASSLTGIAKGIVGVGKAVKSIKDGGSILDVITGLKGKGKLEKDAVEGAEDIAKNAAKGAEKSVGKSSIFKKLTYKPKHMGSDVAKDAEDLAKGAGKAAEKGISKGSFFKNIFSKTAPVEQSALESGTRLAGKIGTGLNIGLSVIDIGKSLFEKGGGKKKYEDVGSSVGSAIGTGVGMAFGGPVGGMVGGMIGQVVGKWGGDIAHKTVQAWNKAGGWKGITKNVKSVLSEMGKDMQRGAKNIASTASKMGSDLGKSISSATKKASKNWNSFWKNAESMAKKSNIGKTVSKTWDGITKTVKKAAKQTEKDISNSEKNKNKTISKGSKTRIKDIQKESKDIVKAINDETKMVVKAANNEYKSRVNLAKKEYSDTVKQANTTRDQAVRAANDKYNRVVKAANEEYSGTSRAATKQRDDVIARAKKQRDDTVASANDQRNRVVNHAEKQRDSSIAAAEKQRSETTSKAEKQRDAIKEAASNQSQGVVNHATSQANSTMKANSEQASGLGKIWNAIVSFFNKLTKPFGVKSIESASLSGSYSAVGGLAYASGGGVSDNGKALVGEAGPELRYKPYSGKFDILGAQGAQLADLEADDEILNADDTAKLLSGNFIGTLPGYAKGTSSLSDFIKKIGDTAGNIFDGIKDDALKVIKDIGNPIDKLKDVAKKAFNLDSVKDLGSIPRDISKGAVDKSIKSISDFISKLKDAVTSHIDSENASLDSNSTSPQATGDHKHWVEQAGIPMKYWDDVNYIVSHESGWNPHATNPSSGAYGLPQSLPAGKMAAAGKDWRDNPITQLKWMYSYVNSAYGGFPQAHAFWISHHAYANGGIANEPSIFGEDGPEMAIPLASPKRSRGYELLGKVVSMFAAEEPFRATVNTTDNSRVEELLEQNNALMQALINVANGQLNALNSGNTNTQVAKNAFYNAFGMDQKRTNFQSI
ncbi:phage tail tape measure protein [Ligilactobacillus aviarius]|uniref:phage tail tape measure protein n=1 Tax=Ligilactobacillus aviarius TaxID=1606 RepID=UPI0024BBA4B2|nr:phage tail tape measure protein [Ligilactobacillus aviarius]